MKPTFNRTFSTPYYPEYKKHQLSKKYARSQPVVPELTSNKAGAFFNMKKYRSLSAPADGRSKMLSSTTKVRLKNSFHNCREYLLICLWHHRSTPATR